ncbi:hypothetical protein SDC9_174003 [bioreactor metagenome]|uniref:Uncharacterized protein n=1 Tax=bioreactor metagenome TaxID=1076179 RepID=A0A645GI21_9ZZZZ
MRLFAVEHFTVEQERSLRRGIDAGEHVEHGRFSGAVGADKPYKLAVIDLDIKILYSHKAAEYNAKFSCFKNWYSLFSHFSPPPCSPSSGQPVACASV